jgi:Nucleotidyltransferase domain
MKKFHKKALKEAIEWIEEQYNPIGIIASGSIIRGNPNKDSDFDIYVIHEQPFRQRIQKYFNGVPCEIFINTIEHTKSSFEKEQSENRPVTAHMIATGKIIKGKEKDTIQSIVQEAIEFSIKPKQITESNLIQLKYFLANLLEDANDCVDLDKLTCAYIHSKTMDKLIDYWFVVNQIPLPRMKERMATIKKADLAFYNKIEWVFKQTDLTQKLHDTNELIKNTIGTTGFFEWESKKLS